MDKPEAKHSFPFPLLLSFLFLCYINPMERTKAQNILNEGFVHTVKDPLWQNIPMTKEIKALTEVDDVQKLARIKQNGPTYHIYPGSVHTRLSHSMGVYHLGRQILVCTFRYSGAAHLCSVFYGLQDEVHIFLVRGVCHHHFYFFHLL